MLDMRIKLSALVITERHESTYRYPFLDFLYTKFLVLDTSFVHRPTNRPGFECTRISTCTPSSLKGRKRGLSSLALSSSVVSDWSTPLSA